MIARVIYDSGAHVDDYDRLITSDGYDGAFTVANNLPAQYTDVTIKLLDKDFLYELDQSFTFNKPNLNLTLTSLCEARPFPTVKKVHTGGPMITFASENGSLTVEKIDFDGGGEQYSSFTNGGIFLVTAPTASFSTCHFDDCYVHDPAASYPSSGAVAPRASGGAIAHYYNNSNIRDGETPATAGSLTISSCEFNNCQSDSDNNAVGYDYQGGAVYFCWENTGSYLRIEQSRFSDCHAQGGGGAICVDGDCGRAEIVVTHCTNCTSNGGGGAIKSGTSDRVIHTVHFLNCSASEGGAILLDVEPAKGRSQNRPNHFAESQGPRDVLYGVYWCDFTNCSATNGSGGAIKFAENDASAEAQLVAYSSFDNCDATGNGGAIYVQAGGLICEGTNSMTPPERFIECTSGAKGGAIYVHSGSLSISNINNIDRDFIFQECTSALGGGAIYHHGNGTLTIDNVTFKACQCDTNGIGGAIYTASADATMAGCEFRGVIDNTTSLILFQPVTTTTGGAIYYENTSGTLSLSKTLISGFLCNTDGSAGGGIYINGLAVLDSVSINLCGAYRGGAIYSLTDDNVYALTLKNGTSITGNILYENPLINPNTNLPYNTRTDAAGIYMHGILTLGASNMANDTITISGNVTESNKPSNLRLGGTDGEWVRVFSNLGTKEGKGEIHVANPGGHGAQFGVEYANLFDYVPSHVFKSDITNRTAIRRLDNNQRKLYWEAMVCKITDGSGTLLHLSSSGNPAVYSSLSDGFYNFASQTFTDGQGTAATPANIEMLVEEYSLPSGIAISDAITVTLKTAATGVWGPDTYYYPIDADSSRCTIYRGETAENASMFTVSNGSASIRLNDIIIDGQSDLGKSKNGNGCAFWMESGATLAMDRLTFVTGQVTDGNALIQNCMRVGNDGSAMTLGGGGVYFNGKPDHVDISYWHLKNCASNYYAGGVYVKTNQLTITNSSFVDCSTTSGVYSSGGGVFAYETNQVTVSNSSFVDCSSGVKGGGLRLYKSDDDATLTLTNVRFDHCRTDGDGGGVYAQANDITFVDCTFNHCHSLADGGAFYFDQDYEDHATIQLTNCTFTANSASDLGGSIGSLTDDRYASLIILGCTFDGAGATDDNGDPIANANDGGAIGWLNGNSTRSLTIGEYQYDNGGETVTKPTVFRNLSASSAGGAVESATQVTVTGAEFNSCQAGSYGGGISCAYNAVFERTSFTECSSDNYGGAISTSTSCALSFDHVTIEDCSAKNGGGIYSAGASGSGGGFGLINDATIRGCTATNNGGGIFNGESATLEGITIEDCTANKYGGGIYVDFCGLTLINSEITGCSAQQGGGFYSYYSSTIKNSEITGCSAQQNGGGAYVYGNYFRVSGLVKIDDNTKTASKDETLNNVYLPSSSQAITIDSDGLDCRSHIGVTKDSYENSYNSQRMNIATGTEANCLDAFRKGCFFDDTQMALPYCFNYDTYTTTNIYFVKSWNSLADVSGISVSDNTITVSTAEGLAYLAKDVNSGNDYAGKTILLADDLNLGSTENNDGKLWIPIGNTWDDCTADYATPFRGTFDGQGHTITGLNSYLPYKTIGLFGVVGTGGEVKNVFIEDGVIVATYVPETGETASAGGLVGQLVEGTVAYTESAETLDSSVEGVYLGGLVGTMASGTLHSSMAMPDMRGKGTMGGLVGELTDGTVANSFANASITVSEGTPATGGLAGTVGASGTLTNCYARLRGTAPENGFGYLAGNNTGTISNCYIPADNDNYLGTTGGTLTSCATYTPTNLVNGKYGFGGNGQAVGSSTLVDKLNANATGTYAQWTRTMGSPINDDYPVLMLGNNICLGSKDGIYIEYSDDLDAMITAYNGDSGNEGGGEDPVVNDLNLTVYQDGTDTNCQLPFQTNMGHRYQKCEMVYPASELTGMIGRDITSMTFYTSTQVSTYSSGENWYVLLKEVDYNTISEYQNLNAYQSGSGASQVYYGSIQITHNEMTINFTTDYHYNGGNLLVCFYLKMHSGNYTSDETYWYGKTVTGASGAANTYSSFANVPFVQKNFLPRVTFGLAPLAKKSNYSGDRSLANDLTVNDGTNTTTSQYLPMYGYYFDAFTKGEYIVPASELTAMKGNIITAITFYPNSINTRSWNNTEQTIFLKEVQGTTLSGSYSGMDGATIVKVASPLEMPVAGTPYTITFDTPFAYNDGDLLIGVYNTKKGDYNTVKWDGVNSQTSGVSAYGYHSSNINSVGYNAQKFLPKTTFTYEAPTPSYDGGNIYLCGVPATTVSINTDDDVRVYISEDLGILQDDNVTLNARAGVTIKNTSGNAKAGGNASWHMFSSAIKDAPMGIVYHTAEDANYTITSQTAISDEVWSNRANFDPPMTTWNTEAGQIGYFPTDTPYGTWRNQPATTGFFDLYAYSEPFYHWMNLKREGNDGSNGGTALYDHWHTDMDGDGNHQKMNYVNDATMPAGKGYLLALSSESMMMADGELNNGTIDIDVTKSAADANIPTNGNTPEENKFRSINLLGNPYQSYLDFNLFATENVATIENTYATRSGGEYIYYTSGASTNDPSYTASQYVHPHQGFFVRVSDEQAAGSYTVTFDNTMRLAGTSEQYSSPYRGQVNYPLVNLLCFDAEGHRDLTTVEVNRPEQGGGHKMEGLRTAEGTLAAQLGAELFQTAFVPEGTNEVPVRFEAYEDGQYTLRWNTLHGEFRYLHLIDNKTGADVDCLAAGEYTFEGKASDYKSRFKLVFDATEDEDDDDDNETFAFFDGSGWVIANPSTGSGTAILQVVDMLGRVLHSETVNGDARINVNAAPGVYVLRLISGESVKTQKIVIR